MGTTKTGISEQVSVVVTLHYVGYCPKYDVSVVGSPAARRLVVIILTDRLLRFHIRTVGKA
jgi:hypothetical protein